MARKRGELTEERLNVIVRYIAYVVLAVAAILLAPEILLATGSILETGMIIGGVAALVLMIIGFIFLMRRVDRAADAKNPADYNKETDQGAHVVETTLVDVIISIVSGFIPSMEKHLPPGMKNRWNPFMPKISPAMPPTLDDPFAPKPKDPITQPGGNKGKSATATSIKTRPVFTITLNPKLTWAEFVALKQKGFIVDPVKTNSQKLTMVNINTNEIIEVSLNQGGPSWVKPNWGYNRLISEMQSRGFTLAKPTVGAGGLLYRNNITGEEFRIMPKPKNANNGDPIEKQLNDYYYRYRKSVIYPEGDHTTIPNK